MNERYIFRGKRIDNGEWVQGFLSKGRYHGKGELVPCIDYEEWGVMLSSIIDPATIGQCTGLRDKNGTLIFEGDIVEFIYWWFDGNEVESTLSGEVVYMPEMMSYALRGVKNQEWIRHIGGEEGTSDTAAFATWRFDEDDFTIIGNVHDEEATP